MPALATMNLSSLEREVVSLFGRFTGADSVAALKLDVDGGSEEFTVGDTVTGGTSGATGVVYAIRSSTGVWDGTTHTGAATLDLITVTGTFQNDEAVTGADSGVADANGTGAADTIFPAMAGVKGKGIASVTNDTSVAGTAGLLTITLEDKWAGLLDFEHCVIDATAPDDWEVTVVSETVASTKTIVVQVFKGGTAAHPSSDETVLFEIVLSNGAGAAKGY